MKKGKRRHGASAFHQILQHGTKNEISKIMKRKINPHFISKNGDTVVTAILKNKKLMENDLIGFLIHFLLRDVDPNFEDARGKMALHLAIRKRMMDVVNLLLSFNAHVDIGLYSYYYRNSIAHFFIEDEYAKCKKGILYPLMNTLKNRKIAEKYSVSFLEFLISKGVYFHCTNREGITPLELAIKCNLAHILPTLLNYTFPNVAGNNYFIFKICLDAIKEKKDMRIIKELIKFYLKKCDEEAATTLYFKLIDTCPSWSELENDYFLTVLGKLIAQGASVDDELLQKKIISTAIAAKHIRLLEFFNKTIDFKNGRKLLHFLADSIRNETSINFCEYFIRNNCDVNAKDERKKTALHVAISYGNMPMARLLIKLGADVNCVDSYLRTPLHKALRANASFHWIKLLLKTGADPNAQDDENTVPLHYAVQKNDLSVVELLLNFGAFANSRDDSQETPLHKMTKYVSKEMVELLLVNGANASATNVVGESLLHVAISRGNASVAQNLIKHGASVNCRDRYQQTPLHRVGEPNNPLELIKLLVTSGADVNAKDQEGRTPLYLAVSNINFSCVLSLIIHGASIDCKTNRHQTLLHVAVKVDYKGHIIKFLLMSGADVNARDIEGNRPIHQVLKRPYVDDDIELIMKMLLRNGADVNARDIEGNTPIHQIFERQPLDDKKKRIMEMLLKNGAYVNARNNQGVSALFLALSRNETCMVNKLLEYSADPNDSSVRAIEYNNKFLYYTGRYEVQFYELPHILLHHLIKLEAANLSFEQDYKTRYKYDSYLQEYYNECLIEVKKLKNTSLGNEKSLFDFLHMNSRTRAAFYINREELQNLTRSLDLERQFPIYNVVILASYHDAVIKKPLLKPAQEALYELISIILPENVDYILDYLTEVELANIIEANALLGGDENKSKI